MVVEVRDEEEARRLRFPGSPTIRVDGEDLFPMPAPRYGLACRIYLTEGGTRAYPPRALIVEALRARLRKGINDTPDGSPLAAGGSRVALDRGDHPGKEVRRMAEKVIDPVCKMEVDPETAPAKVEYRGRTYYFCCGPCKEESERDPERYLSRGEGRGCCD